MPGHHARCSASSAHRWLECAGSINAQEGRREAPSRYAAEGTFAHDIAAKCLDLGGPASKYLGHKGKVEGFEFVCDQEMVDAIQLYVDTCTNDLQNGDQDWVEMPLLAPLSKIDPDLGGTADFVRYRPSTRHLRVVDFKYGQGTYVEADSNEQLKLYALGAMLFVDKPVDTVEVVVVQPRFEGAKPVRSWSFKAFEILDFIGDAQKAAAASRQPDAPLKAGDWCKFCRAARDCPALKAKQDAVVAMEFGAVVDYKALAAALTAIPMVKERIKQIEEFAYKSAVEGHAIPGFKLVDKLPSRQWKSEADVIEYCQKNAIDPYDKPEVLSPAQLEKRIAENAPKGKKKEVTKVLEPFIEKVSSGTALVPESDDRPAVKKVAEATDFAVIDGTAKTVGLF